MWNDEGRANDPAPVAAMLPGRVRFVQWLLGLIVGMSLLATVTGKELWPFSPYRMYCDRVRPGQRELPRLVGVRADTGEEVPLLTPQQLAPLTVVNLDFSLARLLAAGDGQRRLRAAVLDCLTRYERRRSQGEHDGPPLSALRLYRVRLESPESFVAAVPTPRRIFVLEVRGEETP
jgi:hypothetical protein